MNRRDLLKGILAAPVVAALGGKAEALDGYTLTRDPAPLYTMPTFSKKEPCDYNMVGVAQHMIRRARNKLGIRTGQISVHVLNCTFVEASHIADTAIIFNCDVNFKRRPGKGLTKMVLVEARVPMTKGRGAWFDMVFSEEIRIYGDGRRVHLVNVADRYGNEIKK